VTTPEPGPARGPYDTGAQAVDLYTASADQSVEAAASAGLEVTGDATIALGPLVMRQVAVAAPDTTMLVCIEANRRRPSLLDEQPSHTHSEVHSVLWAVDSIDEALPFWRDEAGLVLGLDVPMRGPEVAALLGLPDEDASIRMAMLSDQAVAPSRFELLEHVGRTGAQGSGRTLRGGLHGPLFVVDDVEQALSAMPSADFEEVVEAGSDPGLWRRAVHGTAPGDVQFVLGERS
jgi:hypothetical protein